MSGSIRYRDLKSYKYQLVEPYSHDTDLRPAARVAVPGDYVVLGAGGRLTIAAHYAWDGPSGPTVDTKSFMRGSLVHDALYQLLREGLVAQEHREYADDLLREICREDGMSGFRAWYVHRTLRWFGGKAAARRQHVPTVIITAP